MTYKTCYIKNISGGQITLCGQLLENNQEYQIEDVERQRWATNSTVLNYITTDKILVGDGIQYFSDYSVQINWLIQDVPTEIQDTVATNYYAENNLSMTDSVTINGINIEDGWIEVATLTPDGYNLLLTDIAFNANENGQWRIKIAGNPMKNIFYRAFDYVTINRNLPFLIPDGVKISLEFMAYIDNTSVSGCISGYLK